MRVPAGEDRRIEGSALVGAHPRRVGQATLGKTSRPPAWDILRKEDA